MTEATIKARLVLDASAMTKLAGSSGLGSGAGTGNSDSKSASNVLTKYVKPVMGLMLTKLISGTMFKPLIDAVTGLGKVAGGFLMNALGVKTLGELGAKIWDGFKIAGSAAGQFLKGLGTWIYEGLQTAIVAARELFKSVGGTISQGLGKAAALLPWAGWGALIAAAVGGIYLMAQDIVNQLGSMLLKGGKEGIVAANLAKSAVAPDTKSMSEQGGIKGVFATGYSFVRDIIGGEEGRQKTEDYNKVTENYINLQEQAMRKTDDNSTAFERFITAGESANQCMSIRNDYIDEGNLLTQNSINLSTVENQAALSVASAKEREAIARNKAAEAIRNEANAIKKLRAAKGESGFYDSNLGDSSFNTLHATNMANRTKSNETATSYDMKYAGSSINVKKGSDLDKFYSNPDKYYDELNSKNQFSVTNWAFRGTVSEANE